MDYSESDCSPRLTTTQRHIGESMLQLLAQAERQQLLVVKGLSGVGKSTLVNSLEPEIEVVGGRVVEHDDLFSSRRRDQLQDYHGHLVTTAILSEYEEVEKIAEEHLPDYQITYQPLPGMNSRQIRVVVEQTPNHGQLTDQQRVEFSMGIPSIVKQLSHPGIDESTATRIGARFLYKNIPYAWDVQVVDEVSRELLHVPIPDSTKVILREMGRDISSEHIYDDLHDALSERDRLEQEGITEESPLFVDGASEAIYNQALGGHWASIDILAPELSEEEIQRFKQATGFNLDGSGEADEYEATRPGMFKADYRKVVFWARQSDGHEYTNAGQHDVSRVKAAQRADQQFHEGHCPIKPSGRGENSVFIHSDDHVKAISNPARVGWMVESLFQQRGIPYVVRNRMTENDYAYNPDREQIEVFEREDYEY